MRNSTVARGVVPEWSSRGGVLECPQNNPTQTLPGMVRDSRVSQKAPSPVRSSAVVAGVLGLLIASTADVQALGVSAPQTRSNLGQPLDLIFPVSLASGEVLTTECVRAEVLAGDARVPPGLVTVVLEGPNEASVRAVRLTSLTQVNEPIVTVNLSFGCPARLTRQYVALIDPPGNAAMTEVPALETVQEAASEAYSPALKAALATSESKPERLLARPPLASVATGPARAASAPASAASAAPQRVAAGGGVAPQAKPAKSRKRSPKPRPHDTLVAAVPASGAQASAPVSRLRLDAPERSENPSPLAGSAPQNAASEVATAALAAIAASEVTQSRLSALEESINRLQQQNEAQAARMLEMQARLNAAQSGRDAGPLTWILGLLALALSGFSLYQWRKHEQQRAQWWAAEAERRPVAAPTSAVRSPEVAVEEPASTMQAPQTKPIPIVDAPVSTLAEFMASPIHPGLSPDTLAFQAETAPIPFMDSQINPMDTAPGRPAPGGPMVTVEELLDLEQQVEFFLVLGQTEAAVDLLRSRVETGTSSALPYLKLLEIYQLQGDVGAFSELADRFAQRFNALAPAWGGMAGEGLGLETAAPALRQVQAVWTDPAASMGVVQHLLTHGGQGVSGPEAFDLPAYRDLLLLYSVARDLSEHEVRGSDIDVFLPLDGNSPTDMMATMPMQRPGAPAPLGGVVVDITLEPDRP